MHFEFVKEIGKWLRGRTIFSILAHENISWLWQLQFLFLIPDTFRYCTALFLHFLLSYHVLCFELLVLWRGLKEKTSDDFIKSDLVECRWRSNRTGHGTTDLFQIGKGVRQGCILSPCLFSLYAEYTMQNTRLNEAQAGIKIAGRNINNVRYADDTVW